MPTGPGGLDANGIWQYGEDDTEALASDLLNLGMGSVSTAVGGLGAPTILQVVSTTKTDTFTTTSVTRSDVTGFTASITPASTSSKILVMVDMKTGSQSGSNGVYWYLMRDSSDIYIGDVSGAVERSSGFPSSPDSVVLTSENAIYLDSPSTVSSVTYKVQIATNTSGQISAVNRDKSGTYAVTASSITLIEVAG